MEKKEKNGSKKKKKSEKNCPRKNGKSALLSHVKIFGAKRQKNDFAKRPYKKEERENT